MNKLTSKQRSKLIGLSHKVKASFQLGKTGITPEFAESIREALNKNELIKLNVLKSCELDKLSASRILSERTGSEVVTVIGNKIVLFKYQNNPEKRKIEI